VVVGEPFEGEAVEFRRPALADRTLVGPPGVVEHDERVVREPVEEHRHGRIAGLRSGAAGRPVDQDQIERPVGQARRVVPAPGRIAYCHFAERGVPDLGPLREPALFEHLPSGGRESGIVLERDDPSRTDRAARVGEDHRGAPRTAFEHCGPPVLDDLLVQEPGQIRPGRPAVHARQRLLRTDVPVQGHEVLDLGVEDAAPVPDQPPSGPGNRLELLAGGLLRRLEPCDALGEFGDLRPSPSLRLPHHADADGRGTDDDGPIRDPHVHCLPIELIGARERSDCG
jgi:hypothetical protein